MTFSYEHYLRVDVALIPLQLEHADRMYSWVCDPVIAQNIGLRSKPSLEKTTIWIENALVDPLIHSFAILLRGQHVGNITLDHIDTFLANARLSVYIGEISARKSGVGLTAVYLALHEAFVKLSLHKVWLTVHARNSNAIRTYTKLGFMIEGVLRDEFLLDGLRLPIFYMGLIESDFKLIKVNLFT